MIPKSEAIVIKSFDYRETSRIATFFTKDYGKISGVLKGIRKTPTKFGSSVDRFSINDLVYYHYNRSDLHLISHCDLKQYFFTLRQDYKKNVAANYVMELVDTIMQIEQVNKKVYKLVVNFLHSLENSKDINKLVHIFQIKILALSGFSPHLDSCVKCSQKIEGKARFSMYLGGLLCGKCPTKEMSFVVISKGAISSLLYYEQNNWEGCMRLGLTANVKKELKTILNNFLTFHLEKQLRSAKFLNT